MNRLFLVLTAFILLSIGGFAQNKANPIGVPADYKSDGCTLFPDCSYRECCVEHDKDYYQGGSIKERWKSDIRLFKCVRNTKGWQYKFIAPVMWMGVRVFGVSFLPTPFRWGFGKARIKKEKDDSKKLQKPRLKTKKLNPD